MVPGKPTVPPHNKTGIALPLPVFHTCELTKSAKTRSVAPAAQSEVEEGSELRKYKIVAQRALLDSQELRRECEKLKLRLAESQKEPSGASSGGENLLDPLGGMKRDYRIRAELEEARILMQEQGMRLENAKKFLSLLFAFISSEKKRQPCGCGCECGCECGCGMVLSKIEASLAPVNEYLACMEAPRFLALIESSLKEIAVPEALHSDRGKLQAKVRSEETPRMEQPEGEAPAEVQEKKRQSVSVTTDSELIESMIQDRIREELERKDSALAGLREELTELKAALLEKEEELSKLRSAEGPLKKYLAPAGGKDSATVDYEEVVQKLSMIILGKYTEGSLSTADAELVRKLFGQRALRSLEEANTRLGETRQDCRGLIGMLQKKVRILAI